MRILVVCGAGASSTFVAQRLRRAASTVGLDWHIAAGTEQSIASAATDLVLVGPHLADRVDAIRASADSAVAILPDDIFTDHDGARTLGIVLAARSDSPSTAKGTPS